MHKTAVVEHESLHAFSEINATQCNETYSLVNKNQVGGLVIVHWVPQYPTVECGFAQRTKNILALLHAERDFF